MLSLDSPRWSQLHHAYGTAADIPALLKRLDTMPSSDGGAEPWSSLWSALAHQGDVYPASFAAVPHVVEALATAPLKAGSSYFHFPAWIEICRRKNGTSVPADLLPAYENALSRLPLLVAHASSKHWDENLLLSALAAVAAAKGFPATAEATLELSSNVLPDFLGWLESR